MPLTGAIIELNSVPYTLAHESLLPKGRRAIVRGVRPSQNGDPSVTREVSWRLSGPVGQSRERDDGFLGHDYSDSLDTRNDNLLTSAPARNTLTIDTLELGGTGNSHLGVNATLGGFHLGTGTTGLGTGNIRFIQEHRDHVFLNHGEYISQIEPAAPTLVQTQALGQAVEGMEIWRGNAYIGVGGGQTAQRRTVVTSTGSTYIDVTTDAAEDIEAGPMVATLKHLFFVDRASGTDFNKMQFTLDDFNTVSNAFGIHDTGQDPNGMGSYAGTAFVGFARGAHGFTSIGDPVRLLSSVKDFPDALNGVQFANLGRWVYVVTALGLRAIVPGEIDNPVGPSANRGFEGPQGQARAVFPWKDSIWFAEVVGSDTYTYRGEVIDETEATGQLGWYPLHKVTGSTVNVFGATTLRSLPTLLEGEDDNVLAYIDLSLRAREIDDSAYVFSTANGTWFGSTLMRTNALHCNLRWGAFLTENCTGSNTWQLAVSVDEGSYVNVGSAVTGNGHQVVRPVSGGVPLTTVNFHTLKPRLTQVAASSSSPPQIRGDLTLTYDERPDMVEESIWPIVLGQGALVAETEFDALVALLDPEGNGQSPIVVRLPVDTGNTYGFVTSVDRMHDLQAEGVLGVAVTIVRWDTA